MKKTLTRGVPKYCAAFGDTKDDMRATARGLPAITKLVPTGGSPTCCKKKMGKNLMVMPDAKPNMRSAVARMYGMTLVLRLPLLAGLIPFSAIKQWSLQLNVYAGNTYKCRRLRVECGEKNAVTARRSNSFVYAKPSRSTMYGQETLRPNSAGARGLTWSTHAEHDMSSGDHLNGFKSLT